MKKVLAGLITSAVMMVGMPASADITDSGTSIQTYPHLKRSEIPECYTFGAPDQCFQGLIGDQSDPTFDWFCTTATVECGYYDEEPGERAWTELLYAVIDRLHARVAHQREVIQHQRMVIRRLRARLAR